MPGSVGFQRFRGFQGSKRGKSYTGNSRMKKLLGKIGGGSGVVTNV